jgi:hypothetical protein
MVPYLNKLAGRRFVVADYDLLMEQPQAQLERIARALDIGLDEDTRREVRHFAGNFLDSRLRHSFFSELDFDPTQGPLARQAYLWLRQLATDQMPNDSPAFWSAWEHSQRAVEGLLRERSRK